MVGALVLSLATILFLVWIVRYWYLWKIYFDNKTFWHPNEDVLAGLLLVAWILTAILGLLFMIT